MFVLPTKIKPNEEIVIKVYSDRDKATYYYILNLSKTEDYDLKEICHTIGENEEYERVEEIE